MKRNKKVKKTIAKKTKNTKFTPSTKWRLNHFFLSNKMKFKIKTLNLFKQNKQQVNNVERKIVRTIIDKNQ